MRQLGLALVLLLVASGSTFLLHGRTLSYGFDYDDYHFVRPYSRGEIVAAFQGPWDPAGIERPYYRPLTIAFYGARFEALGINATAHHVLSLSLFSIAAALAGWFAFRLTASSLAGVLTTIVYAAHPAMPYSLMAWVTNQMHLIESIVVLSALIWWDAVRHRSLRWWLPLLGFAVVAFLIKEDGIMLLPAILVLEAIRRLVGRDYRSNVPAAFVVAAAILILLLVGIRGWALGSALTERRPAGSIAWHNYIHGLNGLLRLVPAERRWQPAASWFVCVLPLAALVLWRRLPDGARVALTCGIAIALLFNLPFIIITKAEQMHLVALGAVLLIAGALVGVVSALRAPAVRYGVALACGGGIVCLAAVARDVDRDFEPYGPIVLAHDEMVRGWAAVPVDLREYLARKRTPGADRTWPSDPSLALDLVTFGTHGPETSPDGIRYQWMAGPRVEMLTAAGTRIMTIPLRHAIEAFREPAHVRITSDGRLVDDMILDTSAWRMSNTALRPEGVFGLSRMHRVVIAIDHAWRPTEIIAGSRDDRTLGLQIGDVRLR